MSGKIGLQVDLISAGCVPQASSLKIRKERKNAKTNYKIMQELIKHAVAFNQSKIE